MSLFPISIAAWSFHGLREEGALDVFGYLELLSGRYGLRHADIWSGFLPTLDTAFIRRVRREMDCRELALANLCVDGPHLWDPDPAVRAAHDAKALEYLEAGRILGARTIRIDMGEKEPEFSPESFDYIASTYRRYARLCHDAGIRVGPENHWGASKYPRNLEKMRRAVDHPAYGHLLHLEGFLGRDQEAGYEAVLPITMHVHVPMNALPAAKERIRQAAASGYTGCYSAEMFAGKLELERSAWHLAAMRCMVAELEDEGLSAPAAPDFPAAIYAPKTEDR
jgi:hypothetical protein